MFTRVARGFEELADLGLIERAADPVRRWPGGRLRAGRDRLRAPARTSSSRSASPTPSSARWPSATRPTAATRSSWRATRGGSIEAIEDLVTAEAIRDVARLEGIYPETAGGVTLAAVAAARRRGVIRPGDEVVALLTGNGLKTPDARTLGHGDGVARPGEPGLAPVIRPSLSGVRGLARDGRAHEHGPHPADPSDGDRRGQAGRGRGRHGPRGRRRRWSPRIPASRRSCSRRTAT